LAAILDKKFIDEDSKQSENIGATYGKSSELGNTTATFKLRFHAASPEHVPRLHIASTAPSMAVLLASPRLELKNETSQISLPKYAMGKWRGKWPMLRRNAFRGSISGHSLIIIALLHSGNDCQEYSAYQAYSLFCILYLNPFDQNSETRRLH
jgi:hypothetical protein